MGLDMYLYRYPKSNTREQINKESEDLWKKGIDEWQSGFKDVYQVAYWRKVNFLHGWIVRNLANGVDECQEIPIGKEDFEILNELVGKACDIILKSNFIPQKDVASEGSWEAKYVNDDSKPIISVRWNDKEKEFDGVDERVTYKLDNDACDKLSEILPFEEGFSLVRTCMTYIMRGTCLNSRRSWQRSLKTIVMTTTMSTRQAGKEAT